MGEITKWLYLNDINHLTVREWVNGLWFALSFCAGSVFGAHLIRSLCRAHRRKESLRYWYADVGTRGAIALFFYFLGETIMRGWIWALLTFQNNGWDSTLLQEDYALALIAAGMSTWGALCCIWVFSRSHWAWIGSATVILAFVVFETFIF